MIKLGRNYLLTVQTTTEELVYIKPPFTLEVDIVKNTLGSANACKLRIYNLAAQTRNQLYFNSFNQSNYKSIQLQMGYGDNLSIQFTGNISQCWSVREGVNFITQIECYDGGFAFVNTVVNKSFPQGTPLFVVITDLMNALTKTPSGVSTGITIGAIGSFPGVLPKGVTYNGNPAQILYEVTGGAFSIQNGKAYALKSNEYVVGSEAIVINTETGILNTPLLERTIARFEMLFEPELGIGRLATINSTTFPLINGNYIITGVKQRGIISPVVSGDLITYGEFYYSEKPTPVPGIF